MTNGQIGLNVAVSLCNKLLRLWPSARMG